MPELFEVVGSVLRDLAQARAMSDLYSRDVSRFYEADPVLRNFPVPRAEIAEASFTLVFAIAGVTVDTARRETRNAKISQIFENYGAGAVRAALMTLRTKTTELKSRPGTTPQQAAALTGFETRFLSEDFRDLLRARIVRYFEANRDSLIDQNGSFDIARVMVTVQKFAENLADEPEMKMPLEMFAGEVDQVESAMLECMRVELETMNGAIQKEWDQARDFRIDVDVTPQQIQAAGNATCSIAVKSTIRNYTWSKVDDDQGAVHSIRSLSPE